MGSQRPRSATCEPEPPELIPQGLTTPATTPDCPMGPPISQDGAARDLLPGTHLLARGSVDAACRVTAPQPQVDVGGPPWGA
jgi:hypothetical protein